MSNYFALKAAAVAGSGGYFKTGTIIPWTTATQGDLPGFLICNGTAVSRSTYAALFAVIGIEYGAGDGDPNDITVGTTFNVPNFQQKVMVGQDGNANYTIGDSGGAATPTIAFPNATINMSVTDPVYGTNSRTELANAPLPSHTHKMFTTDIKFNNDAQVATAGQVAFTRGGPGDGPTDFKYRMARSNNTSNLGKTGSEGSSSSHRHNLSKTSSGAASFNQENLNANANTVIAPYQTVTFMIKT